MMRTQLIWPRAKLGMAMLILTESVFFFMLLLAFIYFRDQSLKTAVATLSLRVTSLYTACLLISSLALWRSRITLAILFGGIFLAGQGAECIRILRSGVTMSQGLFGTTFFTLAGVHGLHVIVGLGLLAFAGRQSGMFWHFVVAVWLAIFAVVYVWSFV
jgi:heme/copper-type cytochrome/quinol oxidase subunit 3